MQASELGTQSFQLIRRVHQTEACEIWDAQSSGGQPATLVAMVAAAADNPAIRAAFAAAATWAQRADVTEVVLLSHDAAGTTPWVALVPDPQGRAVQLFIAQMQSPSTPAQVVTEDETPTVRHYAPAPAPPPVAVPPPVWTAPPTAMVSTPALPPVSGPPVSSPPIAPSSPSPWAQGSPQSPVEPYGPGVWRPAQPTPEPVAQPAMPVSPPPPWQTGYPAPVPSPVVQPLPGPGSWPPPRRRTRKPLLLVLIAVVVLLVGGGATTAFLVLSDRAKEAAGGTASPGPSTAPSGSSAPSLSATPHPTFLASAPPVTVLGDTWQPGDQTKIQDFAEWPFAFRTPAEATCQFYVGEKDYKANNCGWGTDPDHTIMAFVIHRCVNGCDAAERAKFETMTPWKPDTTLSEKDATTTFGEVNYGGREQFTMLHYFRTASAPTLEWVVIVQGNCPVQHRDLVLKTINDIRSQTG